MTGEPGEPGYPGDKVSLYHSLVKNEEPKTLIQRKGVLITSAMHF